MRSRSETVRRVVFTPRWIGLTILALVVVIAFIFFGRWQWQRTNDILAAERLAAAQPVAVESITVTDGELVAESIGRPVTAAGQYDPSRQLSVTNRGLNGVSGVWIVTALELEDTTLVPVIRGWLPDSTSPGVAPPTERVAIDGVLTPFETFYAASDVGSEVAAISEDVIRGSWGPNTRNAVIVLQSQIPEVSPAPTPVPPTVTTADVPFPWQNFFYAFQWWVFAGFVVVVWARWLQLDLRRASVAEDST